MPVAFPAQPCEDSVIFRSTTFYQFADALSRPAPLLPVVHANTTPQPVIHLNDIVVLHGVAEVVHPSPSGGTDFPTPARRYLPIMRIEGIVYAILSCLNEQWGKKPLKEFTQKA